MSEEEYLAEEEEEEEEDCTLYNGAVVEKYKFAGNMCNVAMAAVVKAIKPGAKLVDLANIGDNSILEQTSKVFNKGKGENKVEKGIAFPTCINVNQTVCHHSPMEDDDHPPLAVGDVVKIDLGVHIDGYVAVLAHTHVVTDDDSKPIASSPQANVCAAAAAAVEGLSHAMRPGAKNQNITAYIDRIAKDFDVTPVEGVLSHELRRYIIDGSNVIAGRNLPEQKVIDHELEEASVWTLDIAFSSAPYESRDAGKLRQEDTRTYVYKRSLEQMYQLKMKASREVFADITRKFQTFPFSLRHLDAKKARFCISECLKHDLVNPYPVLKSKAGEHVAHFKTTLLLRPNVVEKVTGIPTQTFETDKKIQDPEVIAECSRSMTLKKKKKNKKKGAKAGEEKDEE